MKKPLSVFTSGLIWFAAAVSIAEILTGMLVAPLGFEQGLGAIILGHLIGGVPLLLVALIGARTGQSAMIAVRRSYGSRGGVLFSGLNIVQLVGWTAVMISAGAAAAEQAFALALPWLWPVMITALIIVWIFVGSRGLTVLSALSVAALLVVCVVLSTEVFSGAAFALDKDTNLALAPEALSFGSAVELSAAMPLSWLPVISDYTRRATRKTAAPVTSAVAYSLTSCWMFALGLGAALFTQQSDFVPMLLASGLGAIMLPVVILSTVTTTFLDANSAGVSLVSIAPQAPEKLAGTAACAAGLVLALVARASAYESFLLLISSVFAPMCAIQIVDYFFLKRDSSTRSFCWSNLIIWALGFLATRLLAGLGIAVDTPIGSSLPIMLGCALLTLLVAWARGYWSPLPVK